MQQRLQRSKLGQSSDKQYRKTTYLHAIPGIAQCFGSERNQWNGTDKNYHLSFPEVFVTNISVLVR